MNILSTVPTGELNVCDKLKKLTVKFNTIEQSRRKRLARKERMLAERTLSK